MGLQDREWYWQAKKEKELEAQNAKRKFSPFKKKSQTHWLLILFVQLSVVLALWALAKYVLIPKFVRPALIVQHSKTTV